MIFCTFLEYKFIFLIAENCVYNFERTFILFIQFIRIKGTPADHPRNLPLINLFYHLCNNLVK